jgi:drug/metabolite transporter (DMT)-like permease
MDIALALAAALFFALGTVLQSQVASQASEDDAHSAGFLVQLARKPRWLAGIAANGLGFVAQAWALAIGRLVVVQPLLATSVVFALPLGAVWAGRRISARDLVAALAVAAGLGAFLVIADPSGGVEDANAIEWIVSFAVCGGLSLALVLGARGRSPARRAALLGTAAGILFGLTAGLTKATVEQLDDGVLTIFENWQLYALLVVGWISLTLGQRSLQTGALAPAMATQMSLDPITSVVLGTLAFEETIHETALTAVLALAAFAVMIAGLVVLALSQQD